MAHLENQYGERVIDLVEDEFGFFALPTDFTFDNLAIGDSYSVVADDGDDAGEE